MPEETEGNEEYDAEMVAKAVENWLGNPISRSFLRMACGDTAEGPRLEKLLRKYIGDNINFHGIRDRVGYRVVKMAIDKGSGSFGVTKNQMGDALKDPIFRRALVNVLEGIAKYGVQRPQISIAPFLVVWNFTHCCNLRCQHCYENSDGTFLPDELTTEEAKKAIDDFARAGVAAIAFSGGEPLMRKDFFEVASYAKKKDFYVTVATNGTLVTPEIAKRMKDAGVGYVEISLDGFEKEHDKLRRVPGAWKKACEGIKNCVAVGMDTCAATTVTKYNLKIIPKLVDFIEKKLGANRMIAFNFVPTRRGKEMAKQDLTPQEREDLLKFLYSKLMDKECKLQTLCTAPQYARISAEYASGPAVATHFTNQAAIEALQGKTKTLGEFIGGCGAARLYGAMEPNGDIFPCVFIPIKLGNIREKSIKEIWNKSDVLKKIRKREEFKGHCGVCDYRHVCGGCRARAYGYFGDVQGPDPGCKLNQEYWEKIKREKEDENQ